MKRRVRGSQDEIDFLGVLVFGPKTEVDIVTKDLELFQ